LKEHDQTIEYLVDLIAQCRPSQQLVAAERDPDFTAGYCFPITAFGAGGIALFKARQRISNLRICRARRWSSLRDSDLAARNGAGLGSRSAAAGGARCMRSALLQLAWTCLLGARRGESPSNCTQPAACRTARLVRAISADYNELPMRRRDLGLTMRRSTSATSGDADRARRRTAARPTASNRPGMRTRPCDRRRRDWRRLSGGRAGDARCRLRLHDLDDSRLAEIRARGRDRGRGRAPGFAAIERVTTDPAPVVTAPMSSSSSPAQLSGGRRRGLAPLLRDGQIILLIQGIPAAP